MIDVIIDKLNCDQAISARGAERIVTELSLAGFDFDNMTTVSLFNVVEKLGYELSDCSVFNCVTKIDSARI